MSDLIDRQTAIETAIEAADKWDGGYNSEREGIIRKFFDKIPAVQPTCKPMYADVSDTISRQAAIDVIMGQPPEPHYPSWYAAQIEELPAAQPATNCSEIPNGSDDTISRQAVVNFFNDWISCLDENCHHQSVADMIIIKNDFKSLPSVKPESKWIPVSERLPEDLAEVNVTWVNHEPEPYYEPIKSKPFTASAVYYEGKWYWYSSVCADVLAEYGRNDVDKVDDAIEITAWRPLPEPYQGGET